MGTCVAGPRLGGLQLSNADSEYLTSPQAGTRQAMKAFQLSALQCESTQQEQADDWRGLLPTPETQFFSFF